jgi:hypothetical protein
MLGNPRSFQQETGSLEETRGFLDSAAASNRSNGVFVLIPASKQTAGHQTLARATVYEKDVADFLAKARSANSQ